LAPDISWYRMPTNPTSALEPGASFHERYRIVRSLKAGGMGAVYEVVDERTNSPRALKVMLPSLIADPDLRARFSLEARVTGNIASDHIVRVSDAGFVEATGTPFLVMELLQGEELGSMLGRRGALPPAEVVLYLQQTALALDKTHAADIVHRDLKPDNLFVTCRDDGSPCVKILDFGIAKIVAQGTSHTTQAVGTPIYMAPEQIRGEASIGPRADLYALGHIAYACLVGESYWAEDARSAQSVFPLLTKMVAGMPEPPASRALRRRGVILPLEFDDWMQRAVAPRQDDRFDRATHQVAALAQALGIATAGAALPASAAIPPGGPLIPPPIPVASEPGPVTPEPRPVTMWEPPARPVTHPTPNPPSPGLGSAPQLAASTQGAMVSGAAPARSGSASPRALGAVVVATLVVVVLALGAVVLLAARPRGVAAAPSVVLSADPRPPGSALIPEPIATAPTAPVPASGAQSAAPAAGPTTTAAPSAKAPPSGKSPPHRPTSPWPPEAPTSAPPRITTPL
jgi:serine/threonine protein kinase